MSTAPEVSVVMGVYNGAAQLRATMDSVLRQEGVEFEFIVVDDGSTDGTAAILADYAAADPRLRVIAQENGGLTRALIAGCSIARGRYIARQDCGDLSLPGRLARQRDLLRGAPDAVMATCATEFVGPMDDQLFTIRISTEQLRAGLTDADLKSVRGPSHHGSTMFSREAYEQVGGYRAAFAVAQDLDLWLRLAGLGPCLGMADVLYQAKLIPGAISATRRKEQLATAGAILECAAARRAGQSDRPIVDRWSEQTKRKPRRRGGLQFRSLERARFYHFLAGVLRGSDPKRSFRYYMLSIRSSVLYPLPWLGLARLMVSR